ncbi:hypothetical protein VPH35_127050 [Triticum aestivum]
MPYTHNPVWHHVHPCVFEINQTRVECVETTTNHSGRIHTSATCCFFPWSPALCGDYGGLLPIYDDDSAKDP